MDRVIPVSNVISAGTGHSGSTSVLNSATILPPRTLTAPISVIREDVVLVPVVSRSSTTKVTSDSGVPRSPMSV